MRLTLELETSGLAGFCLSGMGGESSSLVTEIEPLKSINMTHASDQVDNSTNQVTDQVDHITDQVTDQVTGRLTTTPTKCRQAPTALAIR